MEQRVDAKRACGPAMIAGQKKIKGSEVAAERKIVVVVSLKMRFS